MMKVHFVSRLLLLLALFSWSSQLHILLVSAAEHRLPINDGTPSEPSYLLLCSDEIGVVGDFLPCNDQVNLTRVCTSMRDMESLSQDYIQRRNAKGFWKNLPDCLYGSMLQNDPSLMKYIIDCDGLLRAKAKPYLPDVIMAADPAADEGMPVSWMIQFARQLAELISGQEWDVVKSDAERQRDLGIALVSGELMEAGTREEDAKNEIKKHVKNADINARFDFIDGKTLLHEAALRGLSIWVSVLLENGAHVNAVDQDGDTPLHDAACNGHEDAVDALLAKDGVNVNAADTDGNTPLHVAVRLGHVGVVNALLAKNGVDVNAADSDGNTPLHYAACYGHKDMVNAFLEKKGVKVNAAAKHGDTPLHDASSQWT